MSSLAKGFVNEHAMSGEMPLFPSTEAASSHLYIIMALALIWGRTRPGMSELVLVSRPVTL